MLSLCEMVSCSKCNRICTFEVLYIYLQQIYKIISIEDKYFVSSPEWYNLSFSQLANKLWINKYPLKKQIKIIPFIWFTNMMEQMPFYAIFRITNK